MRPLYPFEALVGQEEMRLALVVNAVNPRAGGVLLRGEKGTAKSTAVRALAAILPEIAVVSGCPLHCDPVRPEEWCPACRIAGGQPAAEKRCAPLVTLPLNATEDRVIGGIDLGAAIRDGVSSMQPGLLAEAHQGILYIDEVNLLDDHLVDVVLDASASGTNVVEREGISLRHACRFVLVGTMNPEEGELRPQLLDRFGLCVEVAAEGELEKRVLLMERREDYDRDPRGFIARWEDQSRELAARIALARERLARVRFPGRLRSFVSELSQENNVAGHRADLVMEQAARALAAYEGRGEVTSMDIQRVAPAALRHRRREALPPPPPPPLPDPPVKENDREDGENGGREEETNQRAPQEDARQNDQRNETSPPEALSGEAAPEPPPAREGGDSHDEVFAVGATFTVQKFGTPKDRVLRRGSGRRSRSRVSLKQGRYVRSVAGAQNGDIAFDATIRAAAPHQRRRDRTNGLAFVLRDEDLREKVRERRLGNFLLFLVDASGSMGASGRMAASKGAVMSLLLDAYQKRDRVAMISFRKGEATLNLPPTSSVEAAARFLHELPVGGRTPLSAGLLKAHDVLRSQLLKDPALRPITLVITDGKANAPLGEAIPPVEEALALAGRLAADERIRFMVVDTEEEGMITFGLARRLASALRAEYFKVDDLKAEALLSVVKGYTQ